MGLDLSFFRGKRVFITGHSGFKGTWLSLMLAQAGAKVTGFSLPPEESLELFLASGVERQIHSTFGDVRDLSALKLAFDEARPEIVFHLAAQPIVREGYRDPVGTYATNVMGTVNLLDCVRQTDTVRSVVNVTTDKVYQNHQWAWGYRESDTLDGFDPYANSKSCSELVTHSFRQSFLARQGVAVSTARAGNVIGGGDFSKDRIIPDCIRAAMEHQTIQVRNPYSVRPYQFVLEPLTAYLLIAQKQYERPELAGAYNVGPEAEDCVTTGALATMFCDSWGEDAHWELAGSVGPHEDTILKLDCSKIKANIGWQPTWHVDRAVRETVIWAKAWREKEILASIMEQQIRDFSAMTKY